MSNPVGTIWDNSTRTVFVHQGLRGAVGPDGDQGDQGDQGNSINLLGGWQSGTVYSPLDAVTWRSSVIDGVTSMYTQRSAYPSSVSTIEPQDDAGRWDEVGLTSSDSSLGGVWTVIQSGHPFTKLGQPAALTASGYVLAQATQADLFGIALVREIIDSNTFVLQSTGGIPSVENSAFIDGAPSAGTLYFVSTTAGFLQSSPPLGVGQQVDAIYKSGSDPLVGAVLPWQPDMNTTTTVGVPASTEKFYYLATEGQTDFSGVDVDGSTPDYTDAINVDCFQNGLNLIEGIMYTISSATTLTLTVPASDGDTIEIWVEKLADVSITDNLKLDPLTFDGVTVLFELNYGGSSVPTVGSADLAVMLDGNAQEADVDYLTSFAGGQAYIEFAVAPEAQTYNWIIMGG